LSRGRFHFRGVPGSTRLWRFAAGGFSEGPCLDSLARSASAA
jgi:hypothetical protein